MTKLRQTIARRLKDAQNTAAMLTTYNEADMSAIMALRNEYKDAFEKKHKVKLGFMSFFVKACCHALKEVPEVNAEIDGGDVVYKNFVHMGVAVGTPTGLVVPVVRDADQKSFAQIEKEIGELGARARDVTELRRRPAAPSALLSVLAPHERKVVELLLTEATEKQIAERLGLAASTTHSYITGIFRKYGVRGRAGLMSLWLKHLSGGTAQSGDR